MDSLGRGVRCDGAGSAHGRRKSGGDVGWAISSRHDKKCPVRIARGKVTGRTRLHREHTSFDHERGCKTATVKLQLTNLAESDPLRDGEETGEAPRGSCARHASCRADQEQRRSWAAAAVR